MKVIAYDKFPAENCGIEYVSLDTLFAESDIISLHCPLTKRDLSSHRRRRDSKNEKKGVYILNTSRGALIDAEALLEGIKGRKVGAACLDVYEEEADVFFEDFFGTYRVRRYSRKAYNNAQRYRYFASGVSHGGSAEQYR